MCSLLARTDGAVEHLARELVSLQAADGSWRFGVETGVSIDSYLIILLRTLHMDDAKFISGLSSRLLSKQETNGAWKWFADEADGHLSATVEAYCALLYSGLIDRSDERIVRARQFIISRGGLRQISGLLTKVMLAVTGHYPWSTLLRIPVELMLLPESLPLHFYTFSAPARVHLAPVMILSDRRFHIQPATAPDLSDLLLPHHGDPLHSPDSGRSRVLDSLLKEAASGVSKLAMLPKEARKLGLQRAEQYMLERIEPDGLVYNYASGTILMIYALLARRYPPDHPVIVRAIQGLKSLVLTNDGLPHVQNFDSTVWDTALIADALQQAGTPPSHPSIEKTRGYLLSRQHTRIGDWSKSAKSAVVGGWGFSDRNTMNPDVDDTTAALRALSPSRETDAPQVRDAVDRGLQWVLSIQNKDGGWPAFERGKDNALLAMLPIDGADAAAVDPSTADLTGRVLEYLGRCGLTQRHPLVKQGVDWLLERQEPDGSWYGRWGVCYLYGTWAALTGLKAVGVSSGHETIQKAVRFVLNAQNADGGWGESCLSDQQRQYIPLGASTPSQTAWALDALIAVFDKPTASMERGVDSLIASLNRSDWTASYPTGAGLPGDFYIRYYSYNRIWPLLALAHYRRKYGGTSGG
ncbi:squalene--hopene cyclase [Paenibacillus allorhizosphaerae]|uniref:Sporulenol synthase n=1 Tax=Paenibacillus allorhizosphaerae TaxID=2849866 RepID=A0ABN7TRY7_9BACL|nr:squalene--hopene cyclase [Paenibacillus allorhizosphaerae]CAG7653469.1 Sporulenol synthase [Paenibacillus allorhizosphaerae]